MLELTASLTTSVIVNDKIFIELWSYFLPLPCRAQESNPLATKYTIKHAVALFRRVSTDF